MLKHETREVMTHLQTSVMTVFA